MISYQLTEYGQPLRRVETEPPEPTGTEVLVAVEACGVCHSDLHLSDGYFDLGNSRRLDLTKGRELPFTLGHEIGGVVVACGPAADSVAVGERRVVYPWIGCGMCDCCLGGAEHVCPKARSLGVAVAGGFADHVLVPHPRYLFDAGSVAVTTAATYACSGLTAYSALAQTMRLGGESSEVLVVGLGGLGLAALSLAPSLGVTAVIGADIDERRLEAARARGAAEVVNTTAPDAAKRIKRRTGGGVRAAVDFVGSARSAAFALSALGRGGVLVVVGLFGGALPLSLPLLPLKQLTLCGSYAGSLAEMAALMTEVRAGTIPPLPIEERPLASAQAALDDLRAGEVVGRVVLRP